MASDVDICNLSASHIGQSANIVAIDPPDGSALAAHCARFYPMARDIALEAHAWKWAIKRYSLTQSSDATIPDHYTYAYIMPSDCLRVLSIMPDEYTDEHTQQLNYEIEGEYLFCNEELVKLRYIARVTDTTKWSPAFVDCVSWKLAQYLAGVVVKGDSNLRTHCANQYRETFMYAAGLDAKAMKNRPAHTPIWISDR